jgi:hypothetical protein
MTPCGAGECHPVGRQRGRELPQRESFVAWVTSEPNVRPRQEHDKSPLLSDLGAGSEVPALPEARPVAAWAICREGHPVRGHQDRPTMPTEDASREAPCLSAGGAGGTESAEVDGRIRSAATTNLRRCPSRADRGHRRRPPRAYDARAVQRSGCAVRAAGVHPVARPRRGKSCRARQGADGSAGEVSVAGVRLRATAPAEGELVPTPPLRWTCHRWRARAARAGDRHRAVPLHVPVRVTRWSVPIPLPSPPTTPSC